MKGTYTGKEVSFESWAKGSREKLDQAYNRVKIAMRQSGVELSRDEEIDLSQYLILGSSRNSYGAGVTRIAMEIHKAQGKVDRAGSTVLRTCKTINYRFGLAILSISGSVITCQMNRSWSGSVASIG